MSSPSPLKGKRVLITRPQHQAKGFEQEIESRGGIPILAPAIEVVPPADPKPLRDALSRLLEFDWVLFTSKNGVLRVVDEMEKQGVSDSELASRKLGAIGPATAEVLAEEVRAPDLMPEEYVSEAFLESIGEVEGLRFLLPRADIARADLRVGLSARGAIVTEVSAYAVRLTDDSSLIRQLADLDESKRPDYLTVTSSSTVRGIQQLLERAGKKNWFYEIPIASIGPITSRTVRELGVEPTIESKEYTVAGLTAALERYAGGVSGE